jgi:uncharacterized protein
MPLLMCPNDNSSMQTLNRNGVEFDMCPTCRGVWLDRGELEKLIESARASMEPAQQPPRSPAQPQQGYGERGERGEYGERGHHGHRRKRGFDLFDIFD